MKHRGFTLIEVLIALMVMSALALLAWRTLGGLSRTATITQQTGDKIGRAELAIAQWEADLNAVVDTQVVSTPDQNAKSIPIQPFEFDGQRVRLTRSANAPESGIVIVAWTLRNTPQGRFWQRWASPPITQGADMQLWWNEANRWSRTPLPQDDIRTVNLIPIKSWQVFYYRGNAWSNALSAAGTSTSSQPQVDILTSLPEGIQLTLELGNTLSATNDTPAKNIEITQELKGKLTHVWAAATTGGAQ